jgi:hypothetical protein
MKTHANGCACATLAYLLIGLSACGAGTHAATVNIPDLKRWEQQMVAFGRVHCEELSNSSQSFDSRLADTYYDAERIYYQIADYTKDAFWQQCAQQAEHVYRDLYVFPNDGKIPGYWLFADGLKLASQRTNDDRSRQAVMLLSRNGAYAANSTPPGYTASYERSREVAYVILTYLDAQELGAPPPERLHVLINQALGHIDQWFVSKTATYLQPFMVGLTLEALIRAYEKTGDSRIPAAVRTAVDGLWEVAWMPSAEAFYYESSNPNRPAPDLNLLIAPAFAWVHRQTGDAKYAERGDQIFAGGVTQAFLDGAKQFNQNYRWSFDYVKWR